MGFFTLLLLAIALSLDTFAVSISCGIAQKSIATKDALKFASVLGIFQGVMPIIGWLCGISIKGYIEPVDHWVAFILLLIVGGKMVKDSLGKEEESHESCNPFTNNRLLITMAIATSIDALSIGIGLAMVEVNMLMAFITIGLVTFAVSILGMYSGKRIGCFLGKKMEIIGGIILVAIGIKILIEHLTA